MIASAVIGLIVDDTIHYMTHYTRVYRGDPTRGHPPHDQRRSDPRCC